MNKIHPNMILHKTILELQELMKQEKLTAEELTQFYIDRIYQYDRNGPNINSILEINPDALEIAKSLDAEREKGNIRSHIHGIPVIIKDNMATADKMKTTNGSYLFMDAKPKNDAAVISRLREAGAIILAKSNMDEMACCNGIFSGRGGGVRNPYALEHFANGSSSGSAASIAAGFGVFSLGTDSLSSLRFPAATNSLLALRPTSGLISRTGIISGDIHLSTVGPITKNSEDAAIVIDILKGEDSGDVYTQLEGRTNKNCLDNINTKKIKGTRIGVLRKGSFGFNPEVDRIINENISLLKKNGADIIDDISIDQKPFLNGRRDDEKLLSQSRVWALDNYLKQLSDDSPITSIHQLAHASWFLVVPTLLIQNKYRIAQGVENLNQEDFFSKKDEILAAHQRFITEHRSHIIDTMNEHNLDFITFPTTSLITDKLLLDDDKNSYDQEGRGNPELSSFSGLPEITVPAGYDKNGFPIGISFLGRAFSESDLLAFANAFEKATKHRKLPDLTKRIPPFKKTFPSIPENTLFENRIAFESSGDIISGNIARATIQAFEPRFSSQNIDRSVWFSYTAKENGMLEITTQKSYRNLYDIAVYTGTELKELKLVTFGHWDYNTKKTKVSLEISKDKTYAITLGANIFTVASGYYELTGTFISS